MKYAKELIMRKKRVKSLICKEDIKQIFMNLCHIIQ